jgi:hypothetical protein
MTLDLLDQIRHDLALSDGASLLSGFPLPVEVPLLAGLDAAVAEAPFRHGSRRAASQAVSTSGRTTLSCASLSWTAICPTGDWP